MNKQDLQKQHERVLQDSAQVKEHFKMYKVGKTWLFAGLFTISLGAGIVMGDHPDVHAATTETDSETSQSTATQTNLQAKSIVIGNKTQSQDSAPEMKAAAVQTTTESETQSTETKTAEAQSPSDAQTPATNDTQNQAATANVQTTNLGDVTDESTIEQAKTAAAKTYAQTGTPQQVTAISGVQGNSTTAADPVQAVSATVEDATKTYDNQSDTPATFNVKLSDNLTAPTGWFFTGNENEYKVSASSGDIDLSKVNQNVGSYDITLSDAGLARLNAVQANQKKNLVVSAVTAGKLTIKKASVVTGSVAIENTSKLYDNDATTDPTSFKVTVSSELKAPTDWTVNADGSYTVTIASGDIQANIDSQEPGTYTVNLTASGLQKLNAANSNYNMVASNVTVGNFQIQNNTKLSIGTVRMKTTDTNLPAKVTVSIPRSETVPTDWEKYYDNTGQEDIVYNVPISYFDTSNVNKTTVTSYPLNLTTTALNNLNAANPNTPIKSINIQPGRIIIADGSVNAPVRNLSNFGGGGGNLGGRILSDGDGATLKLGIFGSSTAAITNFTDVIVIPAGLAVANVTTDPTNPTKITSYTKADDPVDVIKNSITQTLATTNTLYTDLTVGQLPDYKGRQAFYFKLGTVTESGDKASVPLNVVVDPDITNVATGNFGDRTVENDAAILYATDDNAYTDGAYTINTGGAYPNIPVVANGLGLTNTETISDGYDNGMWAGSYTIKHIPVQTTYNLKDAAGNIIASAVKTSGMVGDAYDPLTVIPEKITANGTQYILDQTSVPDENTFKKDATAKLQPGDTLATGTTYTAIYKKVIDTTQNQVKITNNQMTWKSATPSTMTVTLPDSLKAPDGWTKTAGTGNIYTVNTADGDLDLSAVQSPVGSYDVTLSKQGLTKLAAVNPDYLFDNTINGVGTLTVNPIKVPVTVKDTAGTTLKENVPDIQLGVNDAGTGADAGVDGYPTAQLKSVTFTYAQNDNNTTGVKSATLVADKAAGTITVTTTYYGTKPQSVATMTQDELGGADAGTGLALQLNDGSMGSGIGFNVTPQITTAQAGTMAALTNIDVVYNQKVTATLVPSDGDGNPIPNTTSTTVNDFPGNSVSVPDVPGYTATTSNVTVPNGPDFTVKVTYTPNTQTVKVQFVDQDGNKLGDAIDLTGGSDSNIDYTKALNIQKTLVSQGYLPINGDKTGFVTAPKVFDHDDKATPTITVKLSKFNDQVPADATLVPVDPNGDPIKNATPTTVTGLPGTDVTAPNVPGYTVINTDKTVTIPTPVPNKGNVSGGKVTTPDKRGTTVNVTYVPNTQTVNVYFVDNHGTKLVTTTLTGDSDSPVSYDETAILNLIPAGYALAGYTTGNFNDFLTFTGAITTFDHDDTKDQKWTVPIAEKLDYETVTTTRTIHFVDSNGKTVAPDKVQQVTYIRPIGAVSKTPLDFYSPMGMYPALTAPTVSGYKAVAGAGYTVENGVGNVSVQHPMKTETPKDESVTVHYIGTNQSANVKYVDDDNNGAAVGTPTKLTGITGGSATWNTNDKPAGYDLADGQVASGSYTFAASDNTDVVIHLTHHISTGTITSTRTISFKGNTDVDESKLPSPIVQQVNWTISTDEVTGDVTFTPDANSNYQAVPLHSIPSGGDEITYVPEFTYVSALNPVKFTLTKDDLNKLGNPDIGKGSTFLNSDETYYYNAIGVPATGAQSQFKGQVPTDNVPSANQYTVNFVTPNGDVIGHVSFVGNPGDKLNVTPSIPKGYVPTPGKDGNITITKTDVPDKPIVFNVTTPAGQDTDGIQVWTKEQVPDAPYANQYTVNFVTPNGDVIGHMSFVGNPGNKLNVTPSIPKGYVPTPGKDGNITISKTDVPDKPIVFNVTTPAGQDADGVQVWTKEQVPDAPYANQYTINFVTPNGDVVGKVTIPANPGVDNTVDVTPDIPAGYVPTPGNDKVYVNIPKGSDPKTPITVNITTPAGKDTDPIQVWTKGEVPTDNVPSANEYTVNFVTPNGDVVGKTTIVGNPGDKHDLTPNLPKGYVPTPGKTGNITITAGDDSKTPIVFNVTTPAGQDTDGIQVWTKTEVPTDNVPSANQYTVSFVTPNGDVVGTTTVVGNPGNRFDVSGNVPTGYVLNGTDGDVEIPNNQDPTQPITIGVTVPSKPADNGGPTDVPDGSSTDHGTGTPTDGTDMTTDGSDNNTVPGGDETGNNPTTGGKTDNNVISTDNGQKTVGQPTQSGGANSGTQSGLVQQSSNAEAGQSQQVTGSKAASQKTGTLPQTNEQNTSVWALLGISLMSMLSLLGFTKQKKREDEK